MKFEGKNSATKNYGKLCPLKHGHIASSYVRLPECPNYGDSIKIMQKPGNNCRVVNVEPAGKSGNLSRNGVLKTCPEFSPPSDTPIQ